MSGVLSTDHQTERNPPKTTQSPQPLNRECCDDRVNPHPRWRAELRTAAVNRTASSEKPITPATSAPIGGRYAVWLRRTESCSPRRPVILLGWRADWVAGSTHPSGSGQHGAGRVCRRPEECGVTDAARPPEMTTAAVTGLVPDEDLAGTER